MVDVIRTDKFKFNQSELSSTGYVVLRKNENFSGKGFLGSVLVLESYSGESTDSFLECIIDSELYSSIEDGDVALIDGRGGLRVVLSRKANSNTLLLTENCDNRCLFCSQPPKNNNDSWLLSQAALAICEFSHDGDVGLSGGEPLLYGKRFLIFLDFIIKNSPKTKLHVLTNGRAFLDKKFVQDIYKRSCLINITFGVPVYSDKSSVHDYLVGTEGAYNDTMLGLVNSSNLGLSIEVRFIPTNINYKDVRYVLEFLSRFMLNISQFSIMNLEPTGLARKNWKDLFINKFELSYYLREAISYSNLVNIPTVLFNFPLCHIDADMRSHSVKSISDWKNYFPDECKGCRIKSDCGGYFSSSTGHLHEPPRKIK